MTETDKVTARIHKIDRSLVSGLLQQGTHVGPAPLTPRLVWDNSTPGVQHVIPTPFDGIDISMGASLTIEAWVILRPSHAPRPIIVCGATEHADSPLLHFFAPGANGESTALTTLFRHTVARTVVAMNSQNLTIFRATNKPPSASPNAPSSHHIVLVVDGLAQIASYYVDGVLLDGGDQLGTGFFELAVLLKEHLPIHSQPNIRPLLNHVSVDQCRIGSDISSLRVYASSSSGHERGCLRTSEVVASFLQGLPQPA